MLLYDQVTVIWHREGMQKYIRGATSAYDETIRSVVLYLYVEAKKEALDRICEALTDARIPYVIF